MTVTTYVVALGHARRRSSSRDERTRRGSRRPPRGVDAGDGSGAGAARVEGGDRDRRRPLNRHVPCHRAPAIAFPDGVHRLRCDPMGGDTSDLVILFAILATRFVVPLFIPRFPLPAILVCLVVDAADQSILQKLDRPQPRRLPELRQGARHLLPDRRLPVGVPELDERLRRRGRPGSSGTTGSSACWLFEITAGALAADGVPEHVRVLLHRLRGGAHRVGTRAA